jgi:hypothetical protein
MLPDICIASHLAILLGFCMIGYLAFIFSLIHSIANIVYCMRTENIESVMCNGRWIMKDHKIMNLNEEEVISSAVKRANDLLVRAGINLPKRMNYV